MAQPYRAGVTFLLNFFVASIANASFYVKYHSDGTASFADTPKSGYVVYQPQGMRNSYTSKPAPTIINRAKSTTSSPTQKIQLVAPSNKETVRSNQGNLLVVGELNNKSKQLSSPVQLYIDGVPYGKPQQSLMFNIRNIDRGEHQVKMALVSEQGRILALSEAITFYMHRNRVKRTN